MVSAARDLIYDVGVCNGDDSAYYLHKGFRVVGVEASPVAAARIRRRFRAELADGRYTLVEAGISETAGEATFWVCHDQPEWSSFDRTIASRNGLPHDAVTIPTCRFGTILERFGPAEYCKIDIEGKDDLCLDDMTPATRPRFVSIEHLDAERQVGKLAKLGFTRFKLVSQRTLRPPTRVDAQLRAALPPWARRLVIAGQARLMRHSDVDWRFPGGSSGPFGEDTPGAWSTGPEVIALERAMDAGGHLADWFDIHAA